MGLYRVSVQGLGQKPEQLPSREVQMETRM